MAEPPILEFNCKLLRTTGGGKPKTVIVSHDVFQELKSSTLNGIKEKLDSCAKVLNNQGSYFIAAGLYILALEEYGKLLLLKLSKPVVGKRYEILYSVVFGDHETKLTAAFDDLQQNDHADCLVINDKAEFSLSEFYWKEFNLGLLADMDARLSIFFSDLSGDLANPTVQALPEVTPASLTRALEELQLVVGQSIA